MKASEILSDESKWCQFAYALDENNKTAVANGLSPSIIVEPSACKFCLVTAIYISQNLKSIFDARLIAMDAIRKTFPMSYHKEGEAFNNHRSFEDIRKVLIDNDL